MLFFLRTLTGLINQPQRLNVCLTRAQSLLVIVGNVDLLVSQDKIWKQVIDFAAKHRCIVTDQRPPAVAPLPIPFAPPVSEDI